MRLAILGGVVAAGLVASPAHACTRLPAPSAKNVPISIVKVNEETKRTAVRVCVAGRAVELARATQHQRDGRYSGVRLGAASAAGHRVAWIEERHGRGTRTAVVTLAAVGRKVRVLRRFIAHRQRTRQNAEVDVVLTRQGDLAWLAGTYGGRTGVVAVKQPGKPTRRLATYPAARLTIEDGRTLRWDEGGIAYDFFDLRPAPCPSRSRYTHYAQNDGVILTRGLYGAQEQLGTMVVRGCDRSTGRDRVILQNYSEFGSESYLSLVGIDRTWAVFLQSVVERDGAGPTTLTVGDTLTGRTKVAYLYNGESAPKYPPPTAADGFAVTEGGVLAWMRQGVLYALVETYKIAVLDGGGAIAGVHAEGDAVVWTHDGVPRRVIP
jgi:hypothetical protein